MWMSFMIFTWTLVTMQNTFFIYFAAAMISVTMANDHYDDICYHDKWLLRWYLLPWQMITTMLYYHEEAMTSNWHLRCKAKQWFLKNYCKHMKNGWKDEFYTCFFMVKSRLRVNDNWHLLEVNYKWEWYISFLSTTWLLCIQLWTKF